MSLIHLSKRQDDLLKIDDQPSAALPYQTAPHAVTCEKKDFEAPKHGARGVPHELVSGESRMTPKLSNIINARRLLGGNGQAEQLILELNSASLINRGPEGVFDSSRLHFDMLLGRDNEIHPSDYLNFDAKIKM